MSWKSTTGRYGAAARFMHWFIAVAVIAMLASGLAAERASGEPAAVNILRFHAVAGVSVVALTLLRILWWVLFDRLPTPVPMPGWQAMAARATHLAFYVVILVLGGSGIAMMVLSGAGLILFAGAAGPLPDFAAFAPRAPHGIVAWLLIGLVAVHIAAALYHQFVLRDRVLARMGIGSA